jgi:hypothetical protein
MNNITGEYKIIKLDEKNIGDVEKLYTAVYEKKPPPDYFKRKYNTTYTGVSNIGFIAYNTENLPIAYYGVIPCFIQHADKIILAAQSADTMTHPEFRYKGMFVELSNVCFDLCRRNGITLIFGFPNQNSYHGAVHKLGWKMTETMDYFVIPVKTFSLEHLASKFAPLKKLYVKYVKLMLHKYLIAESGLANSVISDGYAGVYRNKQYLQYKTYSSTQVIKIDESKLWIKINNGLLIGDIVLPENSFDKLIHKVKKIARKLGVSQIYFHACKHTRLHNLFAKRFNAIPSFPVLFQDFGSGLPLEEIKFTFADIDIF